MGWIERIYGSEEPRLPIHQLIASVAETRRGHITAVQVQSDFSLTDIDRNEIAALVTGSLSPEEIEHVLVRAEYSIVKILAGCESAQAIRIRLGI